MKQSKEYSVKTTPQVELFRKRLKERRAELNISIRELDRRCKGIVSRNTISYYESNRQDVSTPLLETIVVLADAMSVNALWLMGLSNNKQQCETELFGPEAEIKDDLKEIVKINASKEEINFFKKFIKLDKEEQNIIKKYMKLDSDSKETIKKYTKLNKKKQAAVNNMVSML